MKCLVVQDNLDFVRETSIYNAVVSLELFTLLITFIQHFKRYYILHGYSNTVLSESGLNTGLTLTVGSRSSRFLFLYKLYLCLVI